jgi:myo-inositol 2-dehydrogenase/D-chiro-inositol 1-dehydrogenase
MARFLVGSEIQSVFATAGVFIDPAIGDAGDVDTAVVVLTFENGVIGTIDNSRQAVYGYDQRVEVFGSGGSITALNEYPNQVQVSTAQTVYRDLPLHFFLERYAESYVAEMLAFVDAVRTGSPVPVTGHDGKQALLAGLAAGKSLKQGRPVALSEIEHEAED